MADDILRQTTELFDQINLNEINEGWLDDVIDNEFTDVEENIISIGILFVDDPVQTLLKVSQLCNVWVEKGSNIEKSLSGDVSARTEEVLWTYLDSMDINIKQILGLIYLLCAKAHRTTSSFEDKEIGLLSAKWYFSCLRVPGSSAYSVFYANLFRVCIDCLQVPDHVDSKDAHYKWRDYENLLPTVTSTLESLVPLLSVFHLGSDSTTVDYVIKKLCELVASELSNSNLNFNIDFLTIPDRERRRKFNYSYVVTCLAYQGLSSLFHSEMNGDKESIYNVILSSLNRHILCTRVKKSQSIPVKFLVVKDNAVAYVCHNLKQNELCSKLTLTSLKRLCLSVSDKADFRATVSQAVFKMMFLLKVEDLANMIQWLLLLVDAAESNNRVFALEVLGLLLSDTPEVKTDELPENMEVYLTPVPVIFAILTRCDDISPVVRTKALSVISQHMKRALNVLTEMEEPSLFPCEELDEELASDINGDHRCFWYNFSSFKDMLDEIASILHRRIEDNNGIARKAALQALESIVTFDLEYLSDDNLKLFMMAAKDHNIVMRKQMVQSLTTISEAYPNNTQAQEYWLKCILPLVQDPENTVQSKVLSVIEEKFLVNIFSDYEAERDVAFCLLKKLSCGEYLSHQRYLQKAFCCWKAEKKLRPQLAAKLEKYLGNDRDELVWFYLSIFSSFSKIPSRMCQLAVSEFEKPENWEKFAFMEHILKIVGSTFSDLNQQQTITIRNVIIDKLESYSAPVEIFPLMIDVLNKIEKYLKQKDEFAKLATKMIQSSMDILTPLVTKSRTTNLSPEDLAAKCFTVVKEFCQIYPTHITKNLVTILKSFVYPTYSGETIVSPAFNRISPTLQAHAYAALGKISLQEENLAKELLPLLAKQLLTSEEDMIRNNVVIILIEMCKRYTSFADKYLPIISACFKDKRYIIRFQSITMLVSLLQEDYIKWKGPLLYCLLSTITDKKESIQELGKYCLCQLLYEKKKSVFADHFVDSIFVFNHFPPPDNERLSQIVKELERFAIQYDEKREQRMQIYRFMLNYMEPSARAFMINGLCQEILACVAEGVFPLNETTQSMVKDIFAILTSKEIRAYDTDSLANEVEEGEEESAAKAELVARRLMIVEPVIPVIISLKNCVMHNKSDLLNDIVIFLKDILMDYKNDINDILDGDKMLKMQVQFEMRNETMLQEKEAKAKSKREHRHAVNRGDAASPAPALLLEKTQFDTDQLIEGRKSIVPQNVVGTRQTGASSSETTSKRNGSLRSSSMAAPTPITQPAKRKTRGAGQSSEIHDELQLPISVNGVVFASTPRVLLRPLKKMDLPNISKIVIDESD